MFVSSQQEPAGTFLPFISISLLTSYGITLTGADRVIVFDPSWNPAEDRQAVDRAYRIGQTRDVVVYRFIMASSLEQEMYKKEVKTAIASFPAKFLCRFSKMDSGSHLSEKLIEATNTSLMMRTNCSIWTNLW